jgi:CheY-like chemotaxis protein
MRAIRKLPQYAGLPILAITANVTAGESQRCIDAGASAYISKPVEAADLLAALGDWLPSPAPVGGPSRAPR